MAENLQEELYRSQELRLAAEEEQRHQRLTISELQVRRPSACSAPRWDRDQSFVSPSWSMTTLGRVLLALECVGWQVLLVAMLDMCWWFQVSGALSQWTSERLYVDKGGWTADVTGCLQGCCRWCSAGRTAVPSGWSAAAAQQTLCMQPRAGLSHVLQSITAAGCAGSSQCEQGTALLGSARTPACR